MSSRPARPLLLLFPIILVGLALLGSPPVAAEPVSGITLKVEPFYSGHFKFGEWLPLRVSLANDGPAVKAEVWTDTEGPTSFIAPVELPTGARKQLTLYVLPPSYAQSLRVRLMDGTDELASQEVKLVLEKNVNYLVGVIAPRPQAFAALSGLTLNSTVDEQQNLIMSKFGQGQIPRPVRVLSIPLADIADRVEGLRVLDALVITGVDTSDLRAEQGRALQSWVEQGGRLVLGGGSSAARTLAGLPADLRAGLLSGDPTVDLESLTPLGDFVQQPIRVAGPFPAAWPSSGRALLKYESGHNLLVDEPHGLGNVTYSALDLAASPFDAWSGTGPFWEKLLTPGSAYPAGLPTDVSPRMMRANSASYLLQNLPSLELPSLSWIAALLGLYILLVGPVNYLVLRRLRHLEWGWFSIPALTLVFAAGSFSLGYQLRGSDVIINRVSILSFGKSGAAPVQSYVGLFSPERASYTLNFPGRALVAPLTNEGTGWGPGGPTTLPSVQIVEGEAVQARSVAVNQWAMQAFQTESPAPEGWGIEAGLTQDGEQLRGSLTNRMTETLVDPVIVFGNHFLALDDLQPGASMQLDGRLKAANDGPPFPYFLTQGGTAAPWPADRSSENRAREQLLQNYFQNPGGPGQGPSEPLLIGWLRASPLEVQVVGTRWATQQLSLVLADLEIQYAPGPVHLVPGSLNVRSLEIDGDAGLCGPSNQVYINKGSAVIEFRLPEALADMRVTRLTLVITGAAPTVEAQNREGEWIKLPAPKAGRTEPSEPSRFVLAEGTVRLRLSGSAQPGNCSSYNLEVEGINE